MRCCFYWLGLSKFCHSLQVNNLSTSLLSLLLLPTMVRTARDYEVIPRLVIVSSEVHYWIKLPENILNEPKLFETLSLQDNFYKYAACDALLRCSIIMNYPGPGTATLSPNVGTSLYSESVLIFTLDSLQHSLHPRACIAAFIHILECGCHDVKPWILCLRNKEGLHWVEGCVRHAHDQAHCVYHRARKSSVGLGRAGREELADR